MYWPQQQLAAIGISPIIAASKPDKLMPMSAIRFSLLLASCVLGGCASATHNPKDPFESFNRGMYQFNDAVDKAVAKPVAKAYNAVMPPPGKMMVSNFFSNLDDVIVAINDLLQFKILQAVSDGGRVLVNSTVGLFGLADIATVVGMEKHNEDFGQTLGRWGLASGPYLVLPLLGPSSIRDGVGLYTDSNISVLNRTTPVDTRNQLIATSFVSKRAGFLVNEKLLDEAVIDRYSFIRDAYLQRRQSLVYDGNPPREKYDDEEDDAVPDKGALIETDKAVPTAVAESVAQPQAVADDVVIVPQQPAVHRVWVSQQQEVR